MSYTKEQLRDVFRKPFNAEVWKNILLDFFHANEIRTTPQDLELENTSDKGFYLGKNTTSEGLALGFFLFEINSGDVLRKRVGLRNLLKPFLKYDVDAAIAVFNDNKHWRLSFITDFGSNKTAPKRFTYVFGDSAQYYNTPVKRLFDLQSKDISVKNLYDTFSVEALTKEFYNELFEWYKWVAIDREVDITFPNDLATTDDDREIGTHITRLVTRIMFVWFIKQMKLVPDSLFDVKEVNKLLQDFDALSETNGNYYNAILQNLFFATLNQEIPQRKFAEYQKGNNNYGDKNFYRDNKEKSWFKVSHDDVIAMFSQVPFLNGGLFECLDKTDRDNKAKVYYYDGFSREPSRQAHIPNCVFFDNEKGLLPIFNRYQFTIEENTPCEQQVALDPELLGKVFENLLGYINPETNESARNSSGSFYTPREIVNYMVGESVVAYLREKVDGDIEESIRQLANYNIETVDFTPEQRQQITEAIFHCRILDPACGSGAFSMGMLQMLVHILSVVDPDNTYWQEIVMKNAIEASTSTYQSNFSDKERKQRQQEIKDTFTKQINYPDYARKLYLIEQCIYGVDIQPIALQISKLRFFISLVIEQQTNGNKGDNFGIQPLPNLSTKFVCANTLLKPEVNKYGNILNFDKELKDLQDKLLAIRQKYFYAKRADKKKLAQDDYAICKQIGLLIETNIVKPDTEKIASMEQKIKECSAEIEKYMKECWVDEEVLIGATLFEEGSSEIRHYDANKVKRDELTKTIKSCEKEIKTENSKQKPQGFDAAVQQLIDWDPYDVNVTSPFFSPEWMFALDNGFDIVIGNPPYISTKGVSNKDKTVYENEFGFSDDTYNLFFFKGLQLTKEGGSLTYITPKTFWTTQTKRSLRDLILGKKIRYIFDTANPFESAMVDTCITQIVNFPFDDKNKILFLDGCKDLANPIIFEPIEQSTYINTQNSVIFKPTEQNLKIWHLYGEKVKDLYNKWWDKIKTSRDIEKNAEELKEYRESLKPGDIALLGCLTEGGQGLATANNGKYIAVRKSTKWAKNIIESRPKKLAEAIKKKPAIASEIGGVSPQNFLLTKTEQEIAICFDALKEKYGRDIFGQGYIYKLIDDSELANVDELTKEEKENGIDTSKKYYVPYDKGDKDGNRWYLETPFAIAWSKENVQFLKTDPKARYQGYTFYFREGLCWSDINTTFLKCRKKEKSIHDVKSMSIFGVSDLLSEDYIITLINSTFISYYVDNFVNNTQTFQINDARQLPVIIPKKEEDAIAIKFVTRAIRIKKGDESENESLNSIQEKVDLYVEKLYHL